MPAGLTGLEVSVSPCSSVSIRRLSARYTAYAPRTPDCAQVVCSARNARSRPPELGMPLVTVSEVLRLALPPATEVLGGTAGLGNAVTWARLLRARPTSLARIEQGEMWLLSTPALQLVGDPRAVARMIRDMGEAGVVAFVTPEPLSREA